MGLVGGKIGLTRSPVDQGKRGCASPLGPEQGRLGANSVILASLEFLTYTTRDNTREHVEK